MFERMRKLFKKNNKGFSLIELIIVIAILGVIAGIAAPSVIDSLRDAKIKTDITNAATVANATLRAIASGAYTGGDKANVALTDAAFTTIVANLNSTPVIKYTDGVYKDGTTAEVNFFITISNGKVTVSARIPNVNTTETYSQLYPTPAGAWAN